MADIFLSYARADQPRVEQLVAALEEAGYSVWWDRHIKGGNEFSKDIEEAIAASKAVIVVWSEHSAESEWVREEASYARDHNKLVPVRIDDMPPPFGYRQRQAIDLNAPEADEQLHAALDPLISGEHGEIVPAAEPAKRRVSPLLLLLPLLLLVGAAGWYFMSQGGDDTQIALEDQRGVMVLPFLAQSSGEDDQYFADGLTEEILNRLDALDELRVVPRTTAFTYKDTDQALNAIAEEVRVGHIVEGSLRRDGNRVRVTARLVEAEAEQTLWSENYDATTEDVFKVQADIAEKVAASLDILLDADKKAKMADVGIDNPEAFALYARAQELFDIGHSDLMDMRAFHEAVKALDAAFEAEPKLARAPLFSADFFSHVVMDEAGGRIHDELPAEIRASARAELDRRLILARDAAPSDQERLAIEIARVAFSDNWSRIPDLSRRFYASRENCATTIWPGFGYSIYGHADEVFEFYKAQMLCGADNRSHWFYMTFNGLLAGLVEEVEAVVAEGEKIAAYESTMERIKIDIALVRGDVETARTLASNRNNELARLYVAMAAADPSGPVAAEDRRVQGMASVTEMRERNPYKGMQWLAAMGREDVANEWAARIDAAPAGPTVLQIVADECMCGAPFDIAYTPNFRKRLDELGVQWPPKSPVNWPLDKLNEK